MKNGRFSEKVAIVSSASKGIGAGIALAMGREGAAVVVNYSSSEAAAKKVAGITGRISGIEFSAGRRDFVKTVGIIAGGSLLSSSFTRIQAAEKEASHGDGPSQAQKALKIVMVPKFTGTPYFAATEKGAKEAVADLKAKDVAIDFLYTGPAAANSDEQVRMVDDLVAQKPDAIIIAPMNPEAMVPMARKAKTSGIKVVTYDADVADPTARQWFVNQATFTEAGAALVEVVAEQAGTSARFAVVSTDPSGFSQNSWIAAMKERVKAKYPKMQLVDISYGQGKPAESLSATQDLINKYRDRLDAIVAPTVVALPKVAEAVEQAGLAGKIVVTGMATPNQMREFVKRGTVKTVVLWNPVDLGYLAVYVAQTSVAGALKDDVTQARVPTGRLGTRDALASLDDITANGPLTLKNVIVLGNPSRFTKDNIDQFNF